MSNEKVTEQNFPNKTERIWAMIAHFCIIFPVLPCLLIYWILRKQSRFIAFHTSQALRIQLLMSILILLLVASQYIFFPNATGHDSNATLFYGFCAPLLLVPLPFLGLLAGLEAANGKMYKYPLHSDKWT